MSDRFQRRLAHLETQTPEQSWLHTDGLAALLRHAELRPPQPWDFPAVDADDATGLVKLLQDARQEAQS